MRSKMPKILKGSLTVRLSFQKFLAVPFLLACTNQVEYSPHIGKRSWISHRGDSELTKLHIFHISIVSPTPPPQKKKHQINYRNRTRKPLRVVLEFYYIERGPCCNFFIRYSCFEKSCREKYTRQSRKGSG